MPRHLQAVQEQARAVRIEDRDGDEAQKQGEDKSLQIYDFRFSIFDFSGA
jgi:hypothetical protein